MGTENQGGNRLTQVYAKMPIRMMHAEPCMQNVCRTTHLDGMAILTTYVLFHASIFSALVYLSKLIK